MNFTLLQKVAATLMLAASTFIISPGYAQTNCGGPSFPAPTEILTNVPEASGYNLVYQLPIPSANQTWLTQADIPYSVNNSAALTGQAYTRVAYYMKLESVFLGAQWVWVSMDAYSSDLSQISIPTGSTTFQQLVTNMNVIHYSLPPRMGITGNIEMWSNCYNTANTAAVPGASDFAYDFGDEIGVGENCYGSFQIHDFNALETVIAYNGWAFTGATAEDLGIGNFPGTNTDWTLADNAALYDVKELYVFVNGTPAYQPTCNPASVTLDANGAASITADMITDAVVGNCGITDVALSQSSFTCANLGDNDVTVTVTINGTPVTCTAVVTVIDNSVPEVSATGTTLELSCNPTAEQIDAALGSATATDNCGNLVPDVTTDPPTIVGAFNSQTRHFTATDASNNSSSTSRTVTWPADCNVATPHLFQSDVSCFTYIDDAAPIEYVCYTVASNKVKTVSPKHFFYYATIIAPAVLGPGNSFYVDVVQTKSCASFKLFAIQGNQIRAYNLSCEKVSNGSEVSLGQGRVRILNATPGAAYVISVKYETRGLQGSTFSGQPPVCSNSFEIRTSTSGAFGSGTTVAGSEATIEVRPNCVVQDPGGVDSRIPYTQISGQLEEITASPNPFSNYFELNLRNYADNQISIRFYDANGRLIESMRGITSSVVRVGNNWKGGIYFAEVLSGKERKTLRLVKAL